MIRKRGSMNSASEAHSSVFSGEAKGRLIIPQEYGYKEYTVYMERRLQLTRHDRVRDKELKKKNGGNLEEWPETDGRREKQEVIKSIGKPALE